MINDNIRAMAGYITRLHQYVDAKYSQVRRLDFLSNMSSVGFLIRYIQSGTHS